MQIYLSLLVALIGLIVYLISTHGKAAELGRISFFAGLFTFLLQVSPHVVSTLR